MSKKIIFIFSLLFTLGIVIYSCVDDDLSNNLNDEKKLQISTVSMEDVPFLQEKIAHVKRQKTGSSYLDSINTEQVLRIIDTLGVDNFTFSLNIEEDNMLTNVIATKKEDNTWHIYALRYIPNDFTSFKQTLKNGSHHTNYYNGKMQTLDLQGNITSERTFINGVVQAVVKSMSCEEVLDAYLQCNKSGLPVML